MIGPINDLNQRVNFIIFLSCKDFLFGDVVPTIVDQVVSLRGRRTLVGGLVIPD